MTCSLTISNAPILLFPAFILSFLLLLTLSNSSNILCSIPSFSANNTITHNQWLLCASHFQPWTKLPHSGFHFPHTTIHVHIEKPWGYHTPLYHTHTNTKTLTQLTFHMYRGTRILIKGSNSLQQPPSHTIYSDNISQPFPVNPIICLCLWMQKIPSYPFLWKF